MASPKVDIERLSDRELTDLTIKVCRQLISRGYGLPPLMIRDDDRRPVAFLVSVPKAQDAGKEAELVAEAKRRLENPPDKYLTVDELLTSLDDDASTSIPA
jgi:hypothetical protein